MSSPSSATSHDKSNVDYYVDDVVLGSDPDAKRPAFVAPGRRKFFVDIFAEQASLFKKIRQPGSPISCPPLLDLAEVGLSAATSWKQGRRPA